MVINVIIGIEGVIVMQANYMVLIVTFINILLIVLIGIGIFKGIKKARKFVNKVEKLDEKMDKIIKKL